jgi:ABC-type sugar transport system substrate-binding protein
MTPLHILRVLGLAGLAALFAAGCGKSTNQPDSHTSAKSGTKSEYTFALVAKSQSNPVFQAARVGAEDAAARIEEVQTANPDIDGWGMIGSWSLFTDALLKWEPGKVKIVAMDALPAELPYLTKGVVQKLYAQQTYRWGERSVELLVDKVILGKNPANVMDYSELPPVTKDDVQQYEQNWKKWLRQ